MNVALLKLFQNFSLLFLLQACQSADCLPGLGIQIFFFRYRKKKESAAMAAAAALCICYVGLLQ